MALGKRLENKVVLVTGASRGIGASVAKAAAKEGAHVILAARTVGGLEEVDDAIKEDGGQATLVPLDLTQFDKIDELGGVLYQRFGKLDGLVSNAGMLGELAPVGHLSTKIWQKAYDINVHANFRLIRAMDPLLRQSDAGRALFVTSSSAQSCKAYWSLYASSKAALEAMITCYAAELKETNIKVNIIDPGVVRTKMREVAMPGEDPMSIPHPDTITDCFIELLCSQNEQHGQIIKAQAS